MITKITLHEYSDSQVLTVDADKESVAKILAFIAELNKQQRITAKEPELPVPTKLPEPN